MRFIGPVVKAQTWGQPTPIGELDWMLERVRFLVEHRLQADAFFELEVSLIPVRERKLLVSHFRDRQRHFNHEKVRISIPSDPDAPWFSALREAIEVRAMENLGCDKGLFQLLGGRLD